MQRFEYSDFKSNRFWAITAADNEVRVHYGRRGSAGTHKSRCFATHDEALAARDKYIAQMREEGYAPAGQSQIQAIDTTPLNASEREQLASLLEQASTAFADHTTNDYVMLHTPGNQAIADAVTARFPLDVEDPENTQIHSSYSPAQGWVEIEDKATHLAVCDYQLMAYLSECCRHTENSRRLSKTLMTTLADVTTMLVENEYGFLASPEDGADIELENTEQNRALVLATCRNASSEEHEGIFDQPDNTEENLETCSLWLAAYLAKRCYAIADQMPEDKPGQEAPCTDSPTRTADALHSEHPQGTDEAEEEWDEEDSDDEDEDEDDDEDDDDNDDDEYDGIEPALSLLGLKDDICGRLKDHHHTARVFFHPQPLQHESSQNAYERDDITGYFHWDFDNQALLGDSLTVGLLTTTDEEREKLLADSAFWDGLEALAKEACEEAGTQFSSFSVQSDESIQRDGNGFWPPFLLEPPAQPSLQAEEANTQRYEHNERSEEFWEISQTDSTLKLTFGSPFAPTRCLVKKFASPAQASAEQEALIAEKIAQGYIREPLPSAWETLCHHVTQQLAARVGGAELADVKCNTGSRQVHIQILTDCDTECETLTTDTHFTHAVISFADAELGAFGYTCELAVQSVQSNESRAWDDDESEDYDEEDDNGQPR